MRALLKTALAVIVCCLGGCYELAEPIYDTGAYAPLAGRFVRTPPEDENTKEEMTITEAKIGVIFVDYRYKSGDEEYMLRSIGKGLYAVQLKSPGKPLRIVFFDFPDDKTLIVLVADTIGKAPDIKTLSEKFGITNAASQTDPGDTRLQGDKAKITAFIDAHDKTLLSVFADCRRAPNP